MVLEAAAVVGTPARDYFKIEDDVVFEIGLTPNHADAASHYGVARELYAVLSHLAGTENKVPETQNALPDISNFQVDNHNFPIAVEVTDTIACPRYSGITISGAQVADSPGWLKDKLKAIGLAPINNIV